MPRLIKERDLTIEEIEKVHIVFSKKEIRSLGLDQNWRCAIRNKKYHRYCSTFAILYTNTILCPGSGCKVCFYNIHNFLNVHKLIKKIRNEQANKLSKA